MERILQLILAWIAGAAVIGILYLDYKDTYKGRD